MQHLLYVLKGGVLFPLSVDKVLESGIVSLPIRDRLVKEAFLLVRHVAESVLERDMTTLSDRELRVLVALDSVEDLSEFWRCDWDGCCAFGRARNVEC